jgi:hypothetical protein
VLTNHCIKNIIVLITILILLVLSACEESSQCTESTEITAHINFKTVNSRIKDTLINNLTVIGRDTPYYNSNNIKSVNLPLSQSSDTSEFKFTIGDQSDTFVFYSKREHYMVSYECGFTTRFILDTVITTNILTDSIKIIKSTVDISDETNIIFYF